MRARLLVIAVAALATACGGTWTELANGTHPLVVAAREEMEYRLQEERKREAQHESICFEGGPVRSLDLFYNLYSVRERPQLLLPPLERDLIRNMVESGSLYREDAALRAVLTGPVNDALNSRLEAINSGTYNTIYIRIGFLQNLSESRR